MDVFLAGGTGSFGCKFIERIYKAQKYQRNYLIEKVYIYSRDEKKQYDLREKYFNWNYFSFIIGDIRDKERLEQVFPKNIDVVINAAALKHVPQCEIYPIEAIKTNVLGAFNLMEISKKFKVKKYLAISTDKACKPINTYGLTKALQEKLVIASNFDKANTLFSCVRYGNVMNSRGSVIPLFVEKAKLNQSLPVTSEEMTRFLMTLDDSVDLILFALKEMKGGEIFVYKAKSCRIIDLASAIIKKYGSCSDIEIIGIRPGEKINEELISISEASITKNLSDKFACIYPQSEIKFNNKPYNYSSDQYLELDIDKLIKIISKVIGEKQYEFEIQFS